MLQFRIDSVRIDKGESSGVRDQEEQEAVGAILESSQSENKTICNLSRSTRRNTRPFVLVENDSEIYEKDQKSVQEHCRPESNGVRVRPARVSEHPNGVQHDFLHETCHAFQQVSRNEGK